ncbi:MAG: polysaccharide biosynthesis protein [Acetobacter sp.]|nr:polysaccharide biosynthesis protein [Bacteroides sp.]MCM1341147.1 polysaccharide biosynthesis protein [Acetobacter sp.]MCM1433519.1 polysaccharide biosynthesis protein [Clostridiales bacterium]
MTKEILANMKKIMLALCDVILFTLSNLALSYLITEYSDYRIVVLNPYHFIATSMVLLAVNYAFQLYRSVWTFAGIKEIMHCAEASVVNSLILILIDKGIFQHILHYRVLVYYDYIIAFVFILLITTAPRIGYRILKYSFRRNHLFKGNTNKQKRIMIVGAGYMGNTIIEDLKNNHWQKSIPIVAVDDNPAKRMKKLQGIKIAGNCDEIPELVRKYNIDEIIITMPSAPKKRINEIVKTAMSTGKAVKTTPSLDEIIEDNTIMKRIRDVDITDLLSRDEVKLDRKVCSYLINKTILVTGGGGSIGSEICMQCARYNPDTIVIFDIYENCAFELANDLIDKYADKINIQVRIGSVRDINRLEEVFEEFHPDVVFHAAAHKHVPLMENSPCEAVKNNVFGTYNVAVTADRFKVPKMVILSTDKAVNPTNVMGATKRITEIIVQYMNEKSQSTKYAAVRFGNVLGSHGSVIPIFKKQIAQGGPVKVTHPEITRYFMTIPEAAQLVCQAGGLADGGEVFVLDMGEPVKIMDLAENLIKLSGFTVEEIGIEITGLRQGEKLYEELSMDIEMNTREKTANEKIFVNQPMVIDQAHFESMLKSLEDINENNVREKLMAVVPNYHPAKN